MFERGMRGISNTLDARMVGGFERAKSYVRMFDKETEMIEWSNVRKIEKAA